MLNLVKNMSPKALTVDLVTCLSDRKYICKTGNSYEHAGNGIYRVRIALQPVCEIKIANRILLPVPSNRKFWFLTAAGTPEAKLAEKYAPKAFAVDVVTTFSDGK